MSVRGQRYRLTTPTLAIMQHDGQNCTTTIPNGAVVKVGNGPLNGNGLVDVMWDGQTAMMFTTDIRERCVKLEDV
jgi:hypothetical protein